MQEVGFGPVPMLPQPCGRVLKWPKNVVQVDDDSGCETWQHMQDEPNNVRSGLHNVCRVNEQHVPFAQPLINIWRGFLDWLADESDPAAVVCGEETEQPLGKRLDARDLELREPANLCLILSAITELSGRGVLRSRN